MELNLDIAPGELTRADQKILDYINTNTDAFLFCSIGQLARQLQLSDATVSRFARHAGCTDFKALKGMVMELLYLQKTARQLSREEFEQAAQALTQAGRIFLHGKNASAPLAQMLAFRLRRLGLQVSLLPSGGSEMLEGLVQAREGDVVVMFSFAKLSREGRIILDRSKEAGYRTLAFVSRTCIPAEERADISLFAYRGQEQEYHSMAAPTALLDALVVAVSQQLGSRGNEALENLHQIKKKYFPQG